VIFYRHVDPRFPFLWESADQPPARWHALGDGPVQYLSSTPDAAWAEFLRHEEIDDPADVATIERSLWAVDVPGPPQARPRLARDVLVGDESSYAACRAEATRMRERGAVGLLTPSAAVAPETPSGFRTRGGLRPARRRGESVVALFGRRPDLVGWAACDRGRPRVDLLDRVRRLASASGQ
jgi:hypothetical protein